MEFLKNHLVDIRNYLEAAYFLSGIVIAVVALIGLRQLRMMKVDILARNIRAARESAIQAGMRYVNETVPRCNAMTDRFLAEKVPSRYEGPIGDFSLTSLPKGWLKTAGIQRFKLNPCDELNSLESVAAMFTSGVADSEIGFRIIGRSFCKQVQYRYDVISMFRPGEDPDHDSYQNIVDLYNVWSSRFTVEELAKSKNEIELRLASLGKMRQLDEIGPDV